MHYPQTIKVKLLDCPMSRPEALQAMSSNLGWRIPNLAELEGVILKCVTLKGFKSERGYWILGGTSPYDSWVYTPESDVYYFPWEGISFPQGNPPEKNRVFLIEGSTPIHRNLMILILLELSKHDGGVEFSLTTRRFGSPVISLQERG